MLREIMELFKDPTGKIMAAFTVKLRDAYGGNANPYDRASCFKRSGRMIDEMYKEAKKKHPILSKGIFLDAGLGRSFDNGIGMIFILLKCNWTDVCIKHFSNYRFGQRRLLPSLLVWTTRSGFGGHASRKG